MDITHTVVETRIGDLTLVARDGTLGGVYFPHHWHPPREVGVRDDSAFVEAARQLTGYLVGERRTFDLDTTVDGDAYRRRVWARLAEIPYGHTVSYGELADEVGGTPQEVGRAVGRNPLSIVVPCHRVVGRDGALTGYAGGTARKRFLLDLEADPRARLF